MNALGISWQFPWRLWLLAVLSLMVLFFALAQRLRRRRLEGFAQAALLAKLAPGVWSRSELLRDLLRIGVLAALIVALAGPRYGFHWEKVRREGIDLLIALDTSNSMLARDIKPSRLERAKLAVLDLLSLLEGDRIGLVAFAGTAFLYCPLTLDYGAFIEALRAVQAGIIPRGGTSLARAIEKATEGFAGRQGRRAALVLITDGEDHEGDARQAAARAAEMGIRIFVVGMGTEEGELIPLPGKEGEGGFLKDREGKVVKTRLGRETLEKVAEAGGGVYVQASEGAAGLDEIFRQHIAKMGKAEVESSIAKRHEQRFQIPLAVALALLLIEVVAVDLCGLRLLARKANWGRSWRPKWTAN